MPPVRTILNLKIVTTIGPGLGERGAFVDPVSAVANKLGELFVADRGSNSVYKFASDLSLLSQEGGISEGLTGFNHPLGMACDAALNLYVADSGNRRIQVLDRNLHFVKSISTYFDENDESADFTLPSDIAIDPQGNFWVADDDRVLKLDPFMKLLLEISGDSPGYFLIGKAVAVKASAGGLVAIADRGNRRVAVVSSFGNPQGDLYPGTLSSVAWDGENNIWVADPDKGKISAYDIAGNERYAFAVESPNSRPAWLTFLPDGRLVVVDSGLRQIRIYDVIRGNAGQ